MWMRANMIKKHLGFGRKCLRAWTSNFWVRCLKDGSTMQASRYYRTSDVAETAQALERNMPPKRRG